MILGHVDSKTGPAVFAGLKRLRPGNRIVVTMSDRSIVRYRVTAVATYPNARFPARRVYGGTGARTLNLVTCGGRYDVRIGYLSNVVAYTSILHARPNFEPQLDGPGGGQHGLHRHGLPLERRFSRGAGPAGARSGVL